MSPAQAAMEQQQAAEATQQQPASAPLLDRSSRPDVEATSSSQLAPPGRFSLPDESARQIQPVEQAGGQIPDGFDERVVQATAEQTLKEKETGGAEALLVHALQPRSKTTTTDPLTLRSAIERASDRTATARAVKGYWQLSLALADYHHAADEAGYLAGIPSPARPHERALHESTFAAARARQVEAELAVAAAQQDLTEAMQASGKKTYFPSDPPFIGAYRTNFDVLFASRTIPAGLRRIDRTLPILQRLIDARATAVSTSGTALMTIGDAYQRGETGYSNLHEAFLQLRGQRIAFLAAVRDYNYSIADYALSVTTPELGRDAIVSMLIETSGGTRSVLTPRRQPEPEPVAAGASTRLGAPTSASAVTGTPAAPQSLPANSANLSNSANSAYGAASSQPSGTVRQFYSNAPTTPTPTSPAANGSPSAPSTRVPASIGGPTSGGAAAAYPNHSAPSNLAPTSRAFTSGASQNGAVGSGSFPATISRPTTTGAPGGAFPPSGGAGMTPANTRPTVTGTANPATASPATSNPAIAPTAQRPATSGSFVPYQPR